MGTGSGGRAAGEDGSAALYRQIYDRFVNVHHLDNLVWVWNVNAPGGSAGPVEGYFPGAEYADLVTMDIYGEFKQDYYESMLALARGTDRAGGGGQAAEPRGFGAAAALAYFMDWSEFIKKANTVEQAKAVSSPRGR